MKQITVKRVVEALYWIHNNEHHIVGTEFHPTKKDENGRDVTTHVYFQNHFEKLRVPQSLVAEVFSFIRPNRRKFDTRMYALTRAAKIQVSR